MLSRIPSLITWLLSLSVVVTALSSQGAKTLVIVDDAAEQAKYGQFLDDLKARGFDLTFESCKSTKFALLKHGELAYNHLVILPTTSKALGPSLTPKIFLDFINTGGNVFVALSGKASTPTSISSFLLEFDVTLPVDRTSSVVDHFAYDTISASEQHDVLVLNDAKPRRADVQDLFSTGGVIAFPRAVGQSLAGSNPVIGSVLKAGPHAYINAKEADSLDESIALGSQISLVSALQARNSARFTVFGSAEALQDDWFAASVKDLAGTTSAVTNRQFAKRVTEWTFQESGVLKVGDVKHYLTSDGAPSPIENPTIYRIKNEVTYELELSQWQNDQYRSVELPSADSIQLEFTMLSPYQRLDLKPISSSANSTIFSTSFVCPDQHGIFSFRVNYKRPFLTNVELRDEVTLRHFAHDEFTRSWAISGAWTWIAGIWVTVAGWLAFVLIWLFSAPKANVSVSKKVQ